MVHPEYRRVADAGEPLDARLTPIYPLTEGATQGRVRAMVDRALRKLESADVAELLPPALLAPLRMPPLRDALQFVHHPPIGTSLADLAAGRHPAQRRLAFEELLAHQLSLQIIKRRIQSDGAPALTDAQGLGGKLLRALPWPLTRAQQRVLAEVDADLANPKPMVRLIQGDVGCGKTVVAAVAAARAVGSGGQAAFMAPTELLAEQHWRSLDAWFRPLGMTVALLTGSRPARTRRSALEAVASGEVSIAVGTHALFQEGVSFARLDLAIIDEQHRFGVQQRLALRDKRTDGAMPHQLIMTATPIPRTLAMTAHADLDVSVIDELPPGRTPVRTVVIAEEKRAQVVERIAAACRAGRQAYWVCPLIDQSEELEAQAAEDTAATLAAALPEIRVGVDPRPHEGRGQGQDDAGVQERQDPAARGHHRHRSGRGRAEREPDDHRERRAHGPRAAAPAARPRGPRVAGVELRAAVSRAAVRDGARTPRRDPRQQRRIRDRAARPAAARPRRAARHAPDRRSRRCAWRTSSAMRTCCRKCARRRTACSTRMRPASRRCARGGSAKRRRMVAWAERRGYPRLRRFGRRAWDGAR